MRSLTTLAFVAALALTTPALAQETGTSGTSDVSTVVEGLKSKEGQERLAAATSAESVADDAVTKPLVRLLSDDEFTVRAAAIRALGARTTDRGKKDAAKGLAVRLKKLAKVAHGEGEKLLVIESIGKLAQKSSVKTLFDGISDDTSDEEFEARMEAVGQIPDASAIEELIQYLAGRGRGKWQGRKRAVVSALQAATGERLGNDPDKWRAWWKENEKTFDFAAAAERRDTEQEQQDKKKERRRRKKDGDGK